VDSTRTQKPLTVFLRLRDRKKWNKNEQSQ
jgi:hypothetical protein